MKRTPISEANVQKAICELLAAKKILHFRMNAGDRLMQSGGKTYRIRGHERGTADLLAMLNTPFTQFYRGFCQNCGNIGHEFKSRSGVEPRNLWIEVKAPGKKQRPEQIDFQKRVEEYGCSYLLADSVDKVIQWLSERGL